MNLADFFHAMVHLDSHLRALVIEHGQAIYALLFITIACETGILPLFFRVS